MKSLSSEAKKMQAPSRSLGCCNRPIGVRLTSYFVTSAMDRLASVSVNPGAMELMLML